MELNHDDRFVIAKQQHLRQRNDVPEGEPIQGAFSYWILDVTRSQVWGPLGQVDFRNKKTELGVNPSLSLRSVWDYLND